MNIIKASGKKVHFSEKKLRHSLVQSGAGPEQVAAILAEIKQDLYEGMPTNQIYKTAFRLLKKQSMQYAGKYKLKQALIELGPTGYPFEKFISELLKADGFETETSRIFSGKCVTHEIDVVAKNKNYLGLIECKFHNQPGIISDVKVPLYIQSRFLDVSEQLKLHADYHQANMEGWVVTNTRFSTDAIQYARCVGLKLMAWDYPEEGNLKERINRTRVHPITCLSRLSKSEKNTVLSQGIVTINALMDALKSNTHIGIPKDKVALILSECQQLI